MWIEGLETSGRHSLRGRLERGATVTLFSVVYDLNESVMAQLREVRDNQLGTRTRDMIFALD